MSSALQIDTLNTRDGSSSISVERLIKGACAAWVNFNGTGTVAIRAGYNVSSITDNGTGDYTVNFTSPMPDTSYAVVATGSVIAVSSTAPVVYVNETNLPTTNAVRMLSRLSTDGSASDRAVTSVSVFR